MDRLMKKSLIIVAGGSGTRMKSELPKQFIQVGELPILMWTILAFKAYDPSIPVVLVLPEPHLEYWKDLCLKHNFRHRVTLVPGGETRFHSVRNGIGSIQQADFVAIHDGVRPLVSTATITNCFNQAEKTGAAIPVLPVGETLREGNPEHSRTVDRTNYYTVQTPQVFGFRQLVEAYSQDYSHAFTDDATVVEKAGFQVFMVPGNTENIKITTPEDLIIAEAFIKQRKTS